MENIKLETLYKPREIVENGWILNSKRTVGESSYNFVLKLIRNGLLEATNYSMGDKLKMFLVSGKEIVRYKKQVEGVDPTNVE